MLKSLLPNSAPDWLTTSVTFALSLAGVGLLLAWVQIGPFKPIELRKAPLPDGRAGRLAIQKTNIKGTFSQFAGKPSALPGQWPNFRGPSSVNTASSTSLHERLDPDHLPIRWSQQLGEGYAGAAVANGCVYVLDYDKARQSDTLRCFSLDTGEAIWQRAYRIPIKRNHGISRTVPAVSDRYVVSVGPKCHVLCADALTGDFKWGIDLVAQYGTDVPLWYTGQCPLIDRRIAVLAPGGKALMLGVDLESGQTVWETPNPDQFKMSHASIIPMTFFNQRFYVYCAIGGMVGVTADGPDQGRIAWQTQAWNHSVISPSPVQLPDNRILVTAGYGAGSKLFELKKSQAGYTLVEIRQWDKDVFACEQHTPIYYDGLVYTVLPNDAGEYNRQLVCMSPDGKIQWRSGRQNRFGLGPFIIADRKIFVLDDHGVLTIAKTGGSRYQPLSQTQVLQGRESWAPIALADGLMILRDFERMICLDMQK